MRTGAFSKYIASVALLGSGVALLRAQQAAPAFPGRSYTRMITRPDGTLAMQTAAQRLVAEGKPTIWLVGVVHIGARPYYTALQRLLGYSEVVFYEGVRDDARAPARAEHPKRPSSDQGAVTVYTTFSKALGLDFQANDIDYAKSGWTNVDLTMEDLNRIDAEKNGASHTAFAELKNLLTPDSPEAKEFAEAMKGATPGMREAFKLLMVRVSSLEQMPDPTTDPIVLTARNKAVVDALAATFAQPRPPRSIGVFYGAAHLPDLQRTLATRYGYRVDERRWFTSASADPKKLGPDGKAILKEFDKAMGTLDKPKVRRPK